MTYQPQIWRSGSKRNLKVTHHPPSTVVPSIRSTSLGIYCVSSTSSVVMGIFSEETPIMSDRVVRKRCAVLHIVQCSGMDAGGLARRTPTGVRSPGTVHKAKNKLMDDF